MALYPPAIKKLIPPGSNDPRIKPVGGVDHVRAGLGDSLYDYFNGPSDGIESHLYVRKTGVSEQYRDTAYEADANLDGNSFMRGSVRCGLISVETEGLEYGLWTPEQIATMKDIKLWAHQVHDIPLQLIPVWNGDGWGYHTMWGAPSHWTPVSKTCPGPDRIPQWKSEFLPWFKAQQGGGEAEPWPHLHHHEPITVIVKQKLHQAGFFDGPIDDYFGPTLRASVAAFQKSRDDLKSDPDGLFGPLTFHDIMALPDPPKDPSEQFPGIHGLRARLREDRAYLTRFNSEHPTLAKVFGGEVRSNLNDAVNNLNNFLDKEN